MRRARPPRPPLVYVLTRPLKNLPGSQPGDRLLLDESDPVEPITWLRAVAAPSLVGMHVSSLTLPARQHLRLVPASEPPHQQAAG